MRILKLLTYLSCLIIYVVSGFFTLYWASIFFIGSEDTLHRMIAEQGVLTLFLRRFLGFAILGGLIALGITLPKILFTACCRQKNWSEAKQTFKRALLLQLSCALLGSAVFTISVRGSRADGVPKIAPFQDR